MSLPKPCLLTIIWHCLCEIKPLIHKCSLRCFFLSWKEKSTAIWIGCVQKIKYQWGKMASTGDFPELKGWWFVVQRRALKMPILLIPRRSDTNSISILIANVTRRPGPCFGANSTFYSSAFKEVNKHVVTDERVESYYKPTSSFVFHFVYPVKTLEEPHLCPSSHEFPQFSIFL